MTDARSRLQHGAARAEGRRAPSALPTRSRAAGLTEPKAPVLPYLTHTCTLCWLGVAERSGRVPEAYLPWLE